MNIVFNNIKISNFMSIGSAEVDLSANGFTLVKGINKNLNDSASSNGSGKSSIWEAISWVLTGDTIRGCKNVTNCNGDDGALVELNCIIDGNEYIISRSKDHSKLKSSLSIYINGENKSGKGIRDSEKLLSQYLPDLTSSLIGSVIILGQGLPQKFTNNTPSGRKEVLEKLSQSDFMIDDIKYRLNNRIGYFNNQLNTLNNSNIELTTKQTILENSINNLNSKLNTVEDVDFIRESIAGKQTECDKLSNEIDDLNKRYFEVLTEFNKIGEQSNKAIQDSNAGHADIIYKHRSKIEELWNKKTSMEVSISTLEAEIVKKESIKDVCPTCGQKLIGVVKPDTTEDKNKLKSLLAERQKLNDEYDNAISQRDAELSDYDAKSVEIINQIKMQLSKLNDDMQNISSKNLGKQSEKVKIESEIKSLNDKIDFIINRKSEIEKEIVNHQTELDAISKNILYNNHEIDTINLHLSVLNKMNTLVKREFRGYLLSSVISFLDNKAKLYCNDVFGHSYISFELDGNNVSISFNKKEYEQLSGGEKQKVDVIIQLAIRDMLCRYLNFSSNIFVFDEIFDNVDEAGSEKILNLLSTRLNDVTSIYIVTHHSSIQIPVDREITVIKDSTGISRIECCM